MVIGYETPLESFSKEICCLISLSYKLFLESPFSFHTKISKYNTMHYEILYENSGKLSLS